MQARSQSRPMSQPRESRNMVVDAEAISAFAEGDRVFHQKFGYGTVTAFEGDKIDVAFDKAGSKKLLGAFPCRGRAGGRRPLLRLSI